ncbi:tRNA (5-methylaminomethyl-2-thiouridine)(34)-methyltransferase MnmD [uncultured Bacteroides sp.]|uniref:tRNA (5-methylaminomethyl-2-thiouridine)(34)-methyltransferase MnmD n=1 Tax=uncultured Bacteroides sp. TaxID=162156 RepID=UPI002639B054|nr:tRNA (5-methylaminomethyl-2-thiouridine)(34)-methyltransferase MnmD [uncultured Bacteroides sp.]
MQRLIEQTDDGSATLFVPELDEHYHSVKGARTESQHVFIDMGLRASADPCPRVLEIGFGTGLNALLTLEEAEKEHRKVHYTTVERYPLSLTEAEALPYNGHPLFKTLHTAPWDEDVVLTPWFTLHKMLADANEALEAEEQRTKNEEPPLPAGHSSFLPPHPSPYSVVYFDAFAPEKQPEMWSESLFRRLHHLMSPGGILTTYCAKGAVRRLLQAVGFRVERLPGPPGGKREILRAIKQ